MRAIDVARLDPAGAYGFLISVIVPRPIAFVSTLGPDGVANAAPFSFFTGITSRPPSILFCVIRRRGEKKDTIRNLEGLPECVVNIVDEAIAERMNVASGDWPYGVSEFDEAGLTPLASERVRPPRVAESAVHLECRVARMLDVGEAPFQSTAVIAEIQLAHVRDDVLDAEGRVDVRKLRAIGRMSGALYTRTRDLFEMQRPRVGPPRRP